MKNYDIIIIGGSAAGIVTALTGKSNYPNKSFLLIRKEKDAFVPCGIPYIFGTLKTSEQNIMPIQGLLKAGIEFKQDEVIEINRKDKTIKTNDGLEFKYEKLVFATGSTPYLPTWLKGYDLQNVFTIPKDKIYLDDVKEKLNNFKKIIVIGAGFIGVEISDELNKAGKDVTLIEKLPSILGKAFDSEIAKEGEKILIEKGIKLLTNTSVKEIKGFEKTTGVILENGEELEAEAIVLSMGYKPNTELALKSGFELNKFGAIKVDSYLRTEDTDIFAVGDCSAKVDFITRRYTPIMLASTAASEARLVGLNLFSFSTVRAFIGTIAIFSTVIGDFAFASAGITEEEAKKSNFDVITGVFEGIDKHPGTLPNTKKQIVKLISTKDAEVIIGGEIIGGESIGELINVIGIAIQSRMTITELYMAQIGTHPLLTSAPTNYPLIKAAEKILLKV